MCLCKSIHLFHSLYPIHLMVLFNPPSMCAMNVQKQIQKRHECHELKRVRHEQSCIMQSPTPGLHAIVLNLNISLSEQSNAESDLVKHSQDEYL